MSVKPRIRLNVGCFRYLLPITSVPQQVVSKLILRSAAVIRKTVPAFTAFRTNEYSHILLDSVHCFTLFARI